MKLTKPIAITILFILLCEILAGYLYFQRSWERGVALIWVKERVTEKLNIDRQNTNLYNSEKKPDAYRVAFKKIAGHAALHGTKVILLYVPQSFNSTLNKKDFFKSIAEENRIDFLDSSAFLYDYKEDQVFNLPEDRHLSRLGHQLLADILLTNQGLIALTKNHINQSSNTEIPGLKGPHPKNVSQVRIYADRAYRVQTNNQGFRMIEPAVVSGHKNTMLIIGDSFTFGTGVNTQDAYPNILNSKLTDTLVINAGIPGAGITEELEVYNMFINSYQPNILIVQALDNDVSQEFKHSR